MKVADMGDGLNDHLSIQFQHDPQHSVSGRMLSPMLMVINRVSAI